MSVEDIRARERAVTATLSQKDAQLRHIIGDVWTGAKSISAMQQTAVKVLETIQFISDRYDALNEVPTESPAPTGPPPQRVALFQQVGFVVDAGEKIWNSIEGGELLRSADTYTVARIVYEKVLQRNPEITVSMPVLRHQWNALQRIPSAILFSCQQKLAQKSLTDNEAAFTIAAVTVLERQPAAKSLETFLHSRLSSLSTSDLVAGSQPSAAEPEKHSTQILSLIANLRAAIRQASVIFQTRNISATSLLTTVLRILSESRALSVDAPMLYTAVVPPSGLEPAVIDVFQSVATLSVVEETASRPIMEKWLGEALDRMQTLVRDVLARVNSASVFARLEDSVWQAIEASEDSAWDQLCVGLFGRVIRIWSFLRECFWTRMWDLISTVHGSIALTMPIQTAANAIRIDKHAVESLTPMHNDIPALHSKVRKQKHTAKFGIPTAVAPIIDYLNAQVANITDDLRALLIDRSPANLDRKTRYRKPLQELYELSRKSCEALITETLCPLLASFILKEEQTPVIDAGQAHQLLLVAHIAMAVYNSNDIRRALTVSAITVGGSTENDAISSPGPLRSTTESALQSARAKLRTVACQSIAQWGEWIADKLQAASAINGNPTLSSWDVFIVEGEHLRVPAQPSQSMMALYVALCREWCACAPLSGSEELKATVFRVVASRIHKGAREFLSSENVSSHSHQLQAWFDLQSVSEMLCVDRTAAAESAAILTELQEEKMDPVDVALYAPEITPRLQRFIHSHSLLLAPLARTSRLHLSTPTYAMPLSSLLTVYTSPPSASQSSTSTILLPVVPRFSMLPISGSYGASGQSSAKTEARKRVSILAPLSEGAQSAGAQSAQTGGFMNTVGKTLSLGFLDNVF